MTKSDPHRSSVLYANYILHTKLHSAKYDDGLKCYLFRLQAEGACRARVDGNYETILPGDLLLYSPDQPYELSIQPRSLTVTETIQPVGDYYLMGSGAWLDSWWRAQDLPTKVNIGLDDKVITLWKHLIGEKKNMLHHQEQLMDYLLRAFCLTLERVIQTSKHAKGDDTARKLKQYIDNHAHEPLRLEDISASVGLSVSRSSHLFKAAFGQSLYAYCLDVRLKQAEQLVLYSSLLLEHIAENTGFQSYPHFCRMFHKRFGYAPGQYRHRFGIGLIDE